MVDKCVRNQSLKSSGSDVVILEPTKYQPAATKAKAAGGPLNAFSPARSIASVHRRDKIFYRSKYETIDASASIASASPDAAGEESSDKLKVHFLNGKTLSPCSRVDAALSMG